MDMIQKPTIDEVYRILNTRPGGLLPEEVKKRSGSAGEKPDTLLRLLFWVKKVTRQFTHFFALLLWAAAALCFFVERFQPGEGMLTLGWAILLVILINGAFSFIQEFRAEKATQALKNLLPLRATVMREGSLQEIPVERLVEGDIVLLAEGDRIPADIRLVEAYNLSVNNAVLTGESDVLLRSAEPDPADTIFDAGNIVFSGTLVLSGRGRGAVFAAGSGSQFGQVARLTAAVKKTLSPLEQEIARTSRTITVIAVSVGAVFFALGLFTTGRPLWDNLLFAIGILVALVPEGLLPTVTLTLAAGSQRMARRNALVKELNSIETLGCTTVICADKTGTITENNMSVRQIWMPEESEPVRDRAYLVMGLANSLPFPAAEGEMTGDPMEVALIRSAAEYFAGFGGPPAASRLLEFGFSPERKRITIVYELAGGDGLFAAAKGAPETVLPLCRLTNDELAQINKTAAGMAGQAMRVIALACRTKGGSGGSESGLDRTEAAWEKDMQFLGLAGLVDPVRPDVPEAMAMCRAAGIRVMMITGDAAATARCRRPSRRHRALGP